ncbi:iron-containing redox enzyme family protein [Pseudomonas sp. MSSRFD41]|uniref:iron-containing redox enzyme family protein n=1 Tax=Pseudomonas sp. MSSRFD41 TaxID=1310370 RepID=UPI00163B3D1F|nr:iron-containing redox enzyme family protein [Pseudomonas sp. MSSRFD41]MBC2659173.1 iron-containing redox enzyme family protein [Pseudomonas sp. MSSRFD41]
MSLLEVFHGSPTALPHDAPLRSLYHQLLGPGDAQARSLGQEFLERQLQSLDPAVEVLPGDPGQLLAMVEDNCRAVSRQYADYLDQRRQGAGRRLFGNKAHALYFLQGVAPTKLVDGAWLHGVLAHWRDYRYDGLVSTYLEELGEGEAAQNHVALYRRLLAEQGCDSDPGLSDEHYRQGAIQLALGQCAESFMPEVLGYNLGYEQLPLHLLISAYELNELGIDPYYFTLHVTIDNASSGHARKAVQALWDLQPVGMDGGEFWRRVSLGYQLNDLGLGSGAVIQAFDLERELVAMLERKRLAGRHMHADYCRFDGKGVNQWLDQPGQIRGFLHVLQDKGWIKRNQDPQDSRFWQLVHGHGAAMFGVFSGYEKQLLHDWIAGDWDLDRYPSPKRRIPSHGLPERNDQDPETQALRQALRGQDAGRQLQLLLPWLAAPRHCRPAGLFATRTFIDLRNRLR